MTRQEGKIIPMEANKPHKVSEVICVRCGRRWIDVRPADLLLKPLERPNGHIGFAIATGEEIEEKGEGP